MVQHSVSSSNVFVISSDDVEEIDEVIFGSFDWTKLSLAEQDVLRSRFVTQSFMWHVNNCRSYSTYVKSLLGDDVDLSDLSMVEIPQIPVSIFKQHNVMSVPEENVTHSFTSSGTSGTKSIIHRDDVTLQRLCGPMSTSNPLLNSLLEGFDEEHAFIINLGPDREQADNVWFSYVMALVEQVAPMRSYLNNNKIDFLEVCSDLEKSLNFYDHVLLVGAPFLVYDFVKYLQKQDCRIEGGQKLSIFTGGGWKLRARESLEPKDFRSVVKEYLGICSEEQLRDAFNQVELNTIIFECSFHHMHVPPWLHVFARDPFTFDPYYGDQEGVLCYLDASANSFPCFIISDDLGRVFSGKCQCGIEGRWVSISRRLHSAPHQGCAQAIDGLLTEKTEELS